MPSSVHRVLVTRPAAEAQRWTQALCEQGIQAESLPLIDIAPLADMSALQAAWRQVPQHAAVMFVSANAVQHFMAARPTDAPLQTQAWGTGPGTQAALQAAGWPADRIRCPSVGAPSFDSEALWALVGAQVRGWSGRGVLIVRGADARGQLAGRDWLAQQLQSAGVQVQQCVAYVRRCPVPEAAQLERARSALHDGSWWLFSSSEAAQNLQTWLPADIGPQARALATHPRIAERLRQQGWGRVQEVPATLEGQVASIECLT
jgi:uroporphyrinogen-III synthase